MFQRRRVPTQTTSVRPFVFANFIRIYLQSCKRAFERYFCEFVFFLFVGSKLPDYQFDLCRLLLGNSAIYFESGSWVLSHIACSRVEPQPCLCSQHAPTSPTNFPAITCTYTTSYLTEIPTKILPFCTEKHLIQQGWSTDNGGGRAQEDLGSKRFKGSGWIRTSGLRRTRCMPTSFATSNIQVQHITPNH